MTSVVRIEGSQLVTTVPSEVVDILGMRDGDRLRWEDVGPTGVRVAVSKPGHDRPPERQDP